MIEQKILRLRTRGRGTTEVTADIERVVHSSGIRTGVCHVFIQHTSASLMICENADPTVREDMETIMRSIAPDGDSRYRHDTEGPDDMASHARTVLTTSSLTLPVGNAKLLLGTWQGVYLWEHRHAAHERNMVVTVQGEP